MVAPNIVSATAVVAKTKLASLDTTDKILLDNPTSSDKLYKISTLLVANYSSAPAAVTVKITKSLGTINAVSAKIAHEIVVPVNATIAIVNRNTPIYLEEELTVLASASANSALDLVCSYEEVM